MNNTKIGKLFPAAVLIIFLIFAATLMLNTAKTDSAITDELAHIPAGYSYIKLLDFRLNPEHPPLLKAFSALPLLSLNLNFNTENNSWSKDINGQWDTGNQFLYNSGNDADKIIFLSRLFPIILTLLSAIFIYFLSRKILGRRWGLFPALFFIVSPTILSHGHYVTTDIAASFGVITATYFFLKFLFEPKGKKLILAGLFLGVAELMKFSLVLLIPYFLISIILFSIFGPKKRGFFYYLKSLIFIFLIALAVIYAVYFILTLNYPQEKQAADTKAILTSFSPHWLAELPIKFTEYQFTRPLAHYILGFFMVLQRSAGGNTGYFLGEVSAAGSHLYFPMVFLMKESLPSLILIFLGFALAVYSLFKNRSQKRFDFRRFFEKNFTEIILFLFVAIYWAWSIKSPLNIGVRHLIPTFPFIYILAVSFIKKSKLFLKKSIITALLLWLAVESVLASPYFLSYFNQAAGGRNNGYRFVTDSNFDWGQDLKRLTKWVETKNIDKIAVDYFGGGSPKYYLGEAEENWWSARGNPKDYGIEWLAISVNTLQGTVGKAKDGLNRNQSDEYLWLQKIKPTPKNTGEVPTPDFKIGTSIFVYHL